MTDTLDPPPQSQVHCFECCDDHYCRQEERESKWAPLAAGCPAAQIVHSMSADNAAGTEKRADTNAESSVR